MASSSAFINPFFDYDPTTISDFALHTYTPPIHAQHVPNLLPLKLTRDNYLLWKNLFLPVLQNYDMLGIIDETEPCPPQFISSTDNTLTPNLAFTNRTKKELSCKIWINSALSDTVLPYTVGATSSYDWWLNLEKRFAALTCSHLLQLKAHLQTIKKGFLTMLEYIQQIKTIADSLAASSSPLANTDFITHILQGLTTEYNTLSASIHVRYEPLSPEDLHGLLLSEEIAIEHKATLFPLSEPTNHAFHTSPHLPTPFLPNPPPVIINTTTTSTQITTILASNALLHSLINPLFATTSFNPGFLARYLIAIVTLP